MKIFGTAKGGALSKKDFGVAFGGGELEPTYETDFSSDSDWDKTGTSQEISSGSLNYDSVPNNSNQGDCYRKPCYNPDADPIFPET